MIDVGRFDDESVRSCLELDFEVVILRHAVLPGLKFRDLFGDLFTVEPDAKGIIAVDVENDLALGIDLNVSHRIADRERSWRRKLRGHDETPVGLIDHAFCPLHFPLDRFVFLPAVALDHPDVFCEVGCFEINLLLRFVNDVEGAVLVIVEEGAVLSMGVYLGASTKVVDRATGEIFVGRVPSYSVVVPGTLPGKDLPDGTPGPSLYCAVIVKRVDEQTRAKTSINELLRD